MRTEKSGKSRAVATVIMLAMASAAGLPPIAGAETVLRIGMTAADIPRTLGQPDQGFEGNRFTGLTMYDALTMWDLSSRIAAIPSRLPMTISYATLCNGCANGGSRSPYCDWRHNSLWVRTRKGHRCLIWHQACQLAPSTPNSLPMELGSCAPEIRSYLLPSQSPSHVSYTHLT